MLHDAGQEVLLVEANDRLGGRAHSLSLASSFPREGGGPDRTPAFAGLHVDAGCGWLHSAQRNPWTQIAELTGFTVDRSDANWRTQWRDLGIPPEAQSASATAYQDWNERALAAREGPDRPPLRLYRRARQVAPEDRRDLRLRKRCEPYPSVAPRLGRIRRGCYRR
nr:FAD-dependent oxidoreductase [Sphingomonas sp. H160509]